MEEPGFSEPQGNYQGRFLLRDQTVAIVGLGLMGGSLALALRGKCAALLGIDPDPETRRLAIEQGVVDKIAGDSSELLPEASLVILAAPVRSIIALIKELPRLHPSRAVVIDLGSTKVEVLAAMEKLPERLSGVGGHPMCGKEVGGLANADGRLFQDAPFVICPLEKSTQAASDLAEELALVVGARPLWLEAGVHDRWVAATSHLPYLLANTLAVNTPVEAADLVGPGFRSAARLAPSPQPMMVDVLITNRENIIANLASYRTILEKVENALAVGDFELLQLLLVDGASHYEEILRVGRLISD